MKSTLLIVNTAKLVAFTALLSLLLVILASKLGAAELPVDPHLGIQLNKHLEQIGDLPTYVTAPYPFTGPNGVTYILNPDGTMSVGPNQCLRPDGNVTIAKPVLDHAEVMMVDPDSTKLTYPPKLVRMAKRAPVWWDKASGGRCLMTPGGYQIHHFLQVDDAGKEVDPFWDDSLPDDPKPENKKAPGSTITINDRELVENENGIYVLSVGNGGTGVSPPTAGTGISVTSPPYHMTKENSHATTSTPEPSDVRGKPCWNWYSFWVSFLAGVMCFWLGSLTRRK